MTALKDQRQNDRISVLAFAFLLVIPEGNLLFAEVPGAPQLRARIWAGKGPYPGAPPFPLLCKIFEIKHLGLDHYSQNTHSR